MNAVRRLGETARAFKRTRRLAQLQGRCGGVRGGPLEEHLVPSTSAEAVSTILSFCYACALSSVN